MFLFLYGDDTYRSRQKLEAIKQKYLGKTQTDFNLVSFDVEEEFDFEEFVRQTKALPFLVSSRLVIVKNLLRAGSKELQEKVCEYLPKIPRSTIVVFYETGVPDRRARLFNALNQPRRAQQFQPLSPPAIVDWIEKEVENRGGKISRSAAQKLAAISDENLWALSGEIDKLLLYQGGEEITETAIEELVVPKISASAFEILEAVFQGAAKKAIQILNVLFENGEPPLRIIGALLYQLRLSLLLKKDLLPKISRLLGVSQFALYRNKTLAQNCSFRQLKAIYSSLGQIDFEIKTGKIEDKRALFWWLAKLATKGPIARSKSSSTNLYF